MATNKHLTLSERILIEKLLTNHSPFKYIGRELNRDCTTISKEVKSHLLFKKVGCLGNSFNNCYHRSSCSLNHLCKDPNCRTKFCKNCSKCYLNCKHYQKQECSLLLSPPYVCNGCKKRPSCTLEKHLYSATTAQSEYEYIRSESRSGVVISEETIAYLDSIISPLLQKGQSLHHICSTKLDEIMFSEKCIYNYIDAGIFTARNLDLPRKVKYRSRKSKHDSFKVDKKCRINRTYLDFLSFQKENPDLPLVELDSVIGVSGGKVLLTIHFVESQFMLSFLRDSNNSASVSTIFERLYWELRPDIFMKLFPILLTDNGSEFSNPSAIEFDAEGNKRSNVFYCDPSAPYQKGAAENNHEFIRRILPKGTSFNELTQEKVDLMMNHINSYKRKKLGDKSPYEIFKLIYGTSVLETLGAKFISPDNVSILPTLLK